MNTGRNFTAILQLIRTETGMAVASEKCMNEIYPFYNIDIEYSYQFVSSMIGIRFSATMSQYHTREKPIPAQDWRQTRKMNVLQLFEANIHTTPEHIFS